MLAATAGTYYFWGSPQGDKHRERISKWAKEARHDLVDELKNIKEMSKDSYDKISERVIEKYKKFQKKSPKEFLRLVKDVKGYWDSLID